MTMSHGVCLIKEKSTATKEETYRINKIPHATAIGSTMYVILCARPDVSYALNTTRRYSYDLSDIHWIVVKNILMYLRRNKDALLVYGGYKEFGIICYIDARFRT